MANVYMKRQYRGQLSTSRYHRQSGTTTYNFNNRAILTDRPFYGTTPNNTTPYDTEYYAMDVSHIHQPNTPGRRLVSSNTPAEYVDRFYSRPTGRPNVVGIDGRILTSRAGRHDNRGFNGFFPSVKFRVATPTKSAPGGGEPAPTRSKSSKDRVPDTPKSGRAKSKSVAPPPFILELAPERITSPASQSSTHSPTRATSGRSTKTTKSNTASQSGVSHATSVTSQVSARTSKGSIRTAKSASKTAYELQPPVYPYIIENPQVGDLTELPKPMMVVSRDNPWVYRYKVKRSMNELSKILASKPPPNGVATSAFIH